MSDEDILALSDHEASAVKDLFLASGVDIIKLRHAEKLSAINCNGSEISPDWMAIGWSS